MKATQRLALCAGAVLVAAGPMPAVLGQPAADVWQPVTAQRVLQPDDDSWLSYRRTYDVNGFSPLAQINRENVNQLRTLWTYSVPESSRWVPEPLIANGVMYVAEGAGRVVAYNAVTGDALWVHERQYPADIRASQQLNRSRGLAIYNDIIYWGAADSYLVALEAKTGKLVWDAQTGDYRDGGGHAHPPLVADGKVFIGNGGGDRGSRGRVTAHDAQTGKKLWTVWTAPGPGDPGYETWADRAKWPPMGAAPWNTISYDPELKLIYFGTGQPTPWSSAVRGGGDALYSNSVLAVDTATGKIRWHYQMVPGDNWDRAVFESMLVDLDIKGKRRKALIVTSKIGWGVVLDRTTGEFFHAFQTAYDNIIKGWTAKGRPIIDPASIPKPEDVGSGKTYLICPHWHGARNLQAASFSKATGYYYVGVNNSCSDARLTSVELRNAQIGVIGGPGYDNRAMAGVSGAPKFAPGYDYIGEFVAFDPVTGKRAWSYRSPDGAAMTASALATAGGIVFGGSVDRQFFALDDRTGKLLWQTRLGGDVSGSPVTFKVDGRQYVAVASGGKPGPATSFAPLSGVDLTRGSGAISVMALPDPRDLQHRPHAVRMQRHTSGPANADTPPVAPQPARAPAPAPASETGAADQVRMPGPALFTAAQAARGEAVFKKSCATCHGVAQHTGATFRANWGGQALGPLFELITTTMPLNAPGSLAPADSAALIAFMLRDSGYPAGTAELPGDAALLTNVRLPQAKQD